MFIILYMTVIKVGYILLVSSVLCLQTGVLLVIEMFFNPCAAESLAFLLFIQVKLDFLMQFPALNEEK